MLCKLIIIISCHDSSVSLVLVIIMDIIPIQVENCLKRPAGQIEKCAGLGLGEVPSSSSEAQPGLLNVVIG